MKNLNIYLINRKDDSFEYEQADGFVIAAYGMEEARNIAAAHAGEEGAEFWKNHNKSGVELLGKGRFPEPRLVLRSFNAG